LNARTHNADLVATPAELPQCLPGQRSAYLASSEPSYPRRRADLQQLGRLLKDNRVRLIQAICPHYGGRSEFETPFADFLVVLMAVQHSIRQLKSWKQPQRRRVDVMLCPGASKRVQPPSAGAHLPRPGRGRRPRSTPATGRWRSAHPQRIARCRVSTSRVSCPAVAA